MPFPPYPASPAPTTWAKGEQVSAAVLRSDVLNAVQLLTQPPLFIGAATGSPASFTASASSSTFDAPGTAYQSGQTVVLSGGSLPSGVTAGTVYFVVSPNGEQFQLSTSLGGSAVNLTTNGSGTVAQTQQAASAAWTSLPLDATITDAWATHLTTSNQPNSYGMLPGWYLAEAVIPENYTGGSGSVSAGITAQQGVNPVAPHGGQRCPSSGTASRYPTVTAAKLLQFSVAGNYGAPGNNYCAAAMWQDSGAARTPLATATRYPFLQVEWVSALAGNPALPVPDCDVWPSPPLVPSRTFVNKNVRDAISFLAYPPIFEASYSAGTATVSAQSSLPGTGSAVPLDTVNADTYSGFNAGTSGYTFPRPGVYYLYGQVALVAKTTSTACAAGLTLTSANYNGGSAYTIWGAGQTAITTAGQVNCAVVRRRVRVAAGDTVSLAGFNADSSSLAATLNGTTWKPRLIVIWRAR